jgi:hypothetical protein
VTTDPKVVTTDDTLIKSITIKAPGLDPNQKFKIKISGTGSGSVGIKNQSFSNGEVVLSDVNSYGVPASSTGGPVSIGLLEGAIGDVSGYTQIAGARTIEIIDSSEWFDEKRLCLTSFTVEKGTGNKCQMYFPDPNIKVGQEIKIQLTGLDPNESYITYVQENTEKGKTKAETCHTGAEYAAADGVSLEGTLSQGAYAVTVYPSGTGGCGIGSTKLTTFMSTTFTSGFKGVAKACSGVIIVPGLAIGAGTPGSATLSGFLTFTGVVASPCKRDESSDEVNYICPTALGSINTNASAFAKQLFGILLSISGGIALILIINAGYHIMVSEGNPEKLQSARETITAAIIGLVFIIFSLVILQIIGVDILRIPGLTK